MGVLVAIIGKPSSGKSTILNALTNAEAKMGAYPFTTIEPNKGVAYVRVRCPCTNLTEPCNPRTGKCIDHQRFVPIEILDVAGLVPGAHEGKGMGNQFLDDLRQANGFIHVLDISGTTDDQGNEVKIWDPRKDIEWIDEELTLWIEKIIYTNWKRGVKKLETDPSKLPNYLEERLSGLGANIDMVKEVLRKHPESTKVFPGSWDEKLKHSIASALRKTLFPTCIAANKIDKKGADKNLHEVVAQYGNNYRIVPTSGLAELFLRKASDHGIITYVPGDSDFEIVKEGSKDQDTLISIRERILQPYESTGIYKLLNTLIFEVLDYIPVFPVEDTTHMTDADGRVLPDVYLVQRGTTVKEFAGKIHSDFKKYFLHGILVKNGRRVSANHELEFGDVVKIVSSAK